MSLSAILEEISSETKCITAQHCLNIDDIGELELLLKFDLKGDLNLEYQHDLTAEDVALLKSHYGIKAESGEHKGRIRSKAFYDDLPYLIHTGRELVLMLSGVKPMAYFVYYEGDGFVDPIDEAFETHVVSNVINRRKYCLTLGKRVQRKATYIVYTLPGEEWRGDALILLKKSAFKSGWSEGMERMEGALLGYEDWENDVYLDHYRVMIDKSDTSEANNI